MDCKKSTCLYYDETMTDRCARFEPPKVEGCTFRIGLREQNEQLRAKVERLTAANDRMRGTLEGIARQNVAERSIAGIMRVNAQNALADTGRAACEDTALCGCDGNGCNHPAEVVRG